uniref:Uncharacterized protein n=6 Tax=Escherichia coli TaxID=562 RepID=A0A7U1HRZ8_ECOLX|nr:hypothetical protein [Escherichia coli]
MQVSYRSEETDATAGQINTGAEQGYRYRCCRSGDVDEYRK